MKKFPAKLLLFGEHTVNLGSQALAVPLHLFGGQWATVNNLGSSELADRQQQLPQLADYLADLQQRGELLAPLDVAGFQQALAEGLIFESNIPTGYGAGSSGALVAAIFDSWQTGNTHWETELPTLKKALAQMECFFHGTSSGTDPLICFLQKTVLLGGGKEVEVIEPITEYQSPVTNHEIFLLDTGIPRQATPFIQYFLEKTKEEGFAKLLSERLLPTVGYAIEAYLRGNGASVFEEIHRIGEFQFLFLEKLIPEAFRQIWKTGLDGNFFKLKVCGAGGGGFLLGITHDLEATQQLLPSQKLLPVLTV